MTFTSSQRMRNSGRGRSGVSLRHSKNWIPFYNSRRQPSWMNSCNPASHSPSSLAVSAGRSLWNRSAEMSALRFLYPTHLGCLFPEHRTLLPGKQASASGDHGALPRNGVLRARPRAHARCARAARAAREAGPLLSRAPKHERICQQGFPKSAPLHSAQPRSVFCYSTLWNARYLK